VAGDRALGHFTHEKNPVAAAAGLATLKFIEDEGLLARVQTLGEQTLRRLRDMKERHPLIGEARGLGLMLGIELTRDSATKQRATDEAERVMYACLEAVLNFKITMGNILTLTPPLTVTDAEMDKALAILEKAISEVEAAKAPISS
jgi:4-aminobutyrate aminotransferase